MGCSPAFCGPLSSALRGGPALTGGGWAEVAFINLGFAIKHVFEGITQPLCTSFPFCDRPFKERTNAGGSRSSMRLVSTASGLRSQYLRSRFEYPQPAWIPSQ